MSTAPPTPATPTGRRTRPIEQQLAQAAEWIASADGLLIATGAGIGIDSDLPDFRGKEGFWRAYPALKKGRLPFDRIASPDAFRRLPSTAWGFYRHRLNLYRATQPHAGFALLRTWGERMQQRGSRLIRINPDDARVNNPQAIELALGARDALEQINALLV